MGRYHSYLNTAGRLLADYKGTGPFPVFSARFFSLHKKYGSKDRKWINHLCYCFFRMGKAGRDLPPEDRILAGLFLCSRSPNEMLAELRPEWNEEISRTAEGKWEYLAGRFPKLVLRLNDVFPWSALCSPRVDARLFILSHFTQPYLFLRLRPGKEETVKDKFSKAGIDFRMLEGHCMAVQNTTRIGTVIELDQEAVVQDYSSQRVGNMMTRSGLTPPVKTWDCCAASGGKSILAHDILGPLELTVSDIRKSILANLRNRFARAGIRNYQMVQGDLTDPGFFIPAAKYDLLVADLPCTGSGTWSRTPEQLYYFEEKRISEFAGLQKKICTRIAPSLRPGGMFLYITCSVFRQENEDAVQFLENYCGLQLLEMELIAGYKDHADTLFTALLQRPL